MAPRERLNALEGHINGTSNMSADLEQALAQGVKDGKVPHAVVYATNHDGSFTYKHATGFQHLGKDEESVQEDSLFMLASASKVITAVAGLKAVELGFTGLDDDVSPHLPELGKLQVLHGFDDNEKPILKDRKNPITIRQLLSHSAGHTYGFNPDIIKYAAATGQPSPLTALEATIVERYDTPLAFEPGTSWSYGPGLDWTGLLIHRLTGLTLDEFQKKHFWEPLGIKGLTYWPGDEWKKSKTPQLTVRGPDGRLAPFDGDTLNTHSTECFGGHGMYAQMGDYLKVLHSLLKNDGKLLKPENVEELFRPQLGDDSKAALNQFISAWHTMIPGEFNPDIPTSYALGELCFWKTMLGGGRRGR
ncbi:Putative beta-lactamase/transpeptidase [Septoria linicola]|uniref:Beta-lactamase/transpeptidase n=1 Tax=Septoria linicola TaxID=215465 RepID=A0A9Q9EHW8_9PEZI|nr:Putative beta-lactamase/transpeptidase [Septoria linicola]